MRSLTDLNEDYYFWSKYNSTWHNELTWPKMR